MNYSWEQLDTGFKVLFGLFGTVAGFLGIGKLARLNKADAASNDAAIAVTISEQTVSQSVTNELERLAVMVEAQNKKIDDLMTKVAHLEAEVHRLNNGRQTALKLLRKINLCGECDAKYGVLLETAITNLDEVAN